jgi:hypothetical protein
MTYKTKVIAFRVTEHQYEVLTRLKKKNQRLNMSHALSYLLTDSDEYWNESENLRKEQQRAVAKARRDAKKAAANVQP